jgi:hypothetical protein
MNEPLRVLWVSQPSVSVSEVDLEEAMRRAGMASARSIWRRT